MIREGTLLCDPSRKRALELRNQQNVVQLVTSFHDQYQDRNPFTVGLLEELHRLTVEGIYPCAGDVRQHYTDQVTIKATFVPAAPADVGPRLTDLVYRAQNWRNELAPPEKVPEIGAPLGPLGTVRIGRLNIATDLFYEFLLIHPFRGGNGRVSRAFLHLVLYDMEVMTPPNEIFAYFERRRAQYFTALEAADHGEIQPLRDYVTRGVIDAILEHILRVISGLPAVYNHLNRDLRKFLSAPHRDVLTDESYNRRLKLLNRNLAQTRRRLESKPGARVGVDQR